MFLFALAIVVMSCIFGASFKELINAGNAHSHNVFYVYTPNGEVSDKLAQAVTDESTGIDFIRMQDSYSLGDFSASFRLGMFETFEISAYDSEFYTNTVLLDMTVGRDMKLVAGKKSDLANDEIVITTKMADALIARSSVGYIREYADLVGLLSTNITFNGKSVRIAGVVESDESAVYMSEIAMAKHVKSVLSESNTALASDFGLNVDEGKTVLVKGSGVDDKSYPSVGDVITVQGKKLEVAEIIVSYLKYSDWLDGNSVAKIDIDTYFEERVSVEFPELSFGSAEYIAKVAELKDLKYFEYYDYYYGELDAFLKSRYLCTGDMALWIYFEKGITKMKYYYCDADYSKAATYKMRNGVYPTKAEFDIMKPFLTGKDATYGDEYLIFEDDYYYILYEDEFYASPASQGLSLPSYLVSDSDYVELSKRAGETHSSADTDYQNTVFTVVHSTDPEITKAWLQREFSTLTHERYKAIVTPDDIYEGIIQDKREDIISSVVSIVVMLSIMSFCMYFIMRASMMNRIKEIGIYRAIGVSKKNLVFRFLIESVVLSSMTVLLGYFAVSAFVYVGYSISPLVSEILFYPVWYALIVFVVITGISLVCGILPVVFLLRKTPSEILAKYDI